MWKEQVSAQAGPETQAGVRGPGSGASGRNAGMGGVNFSPLPSAPQEASLRFTLPGSGTEGPAKQENYILGTCG